MRSKSEIAKQMHRVKDGLEFHDEDSEYHVRLAGQYSVLKWLLMKSDSEVNDKCPYCDSRGFEVVESPYEGPDIVECENCHQYPIFHNE